MARSWVSGINAIHGATSFIAMAFPTLHPAGEPEQTGLIPLGSTVYKQTGGFTNESITAILFSFLVDFRYGAKIYSGTNLLLYYYGLSKATLQGRETGFVGKGVLDNGHTNGIAVPRNNISRISPPPERIISPRSSSMMRAL